MYVLYIWSHFFKSDFFKSDFRYMLADKLTSKAEYFAYLNIVDTTYFLESIFLTAPVCWPKASLNVEFWTGKWDLCGSG